MRSEDSMLVSSLFYKILPLQFCVAQWSGLVEGYTMCHCIILLERTSGSGFVAGVTII